MIKALVTQNRRSDLPACCAFGLVMNPMRSAICNKQHKHSWMLQCKDYFIKHRLRYFETNLSSTVSLVAEKWLVSMQKARIGRRMSASQWNFLLLTQVPDSVLEFRFVHCKFTWQTLGEESTCAKPPPTYHPPGRPQQVSHTRWQVQSCGHLETGCEKCSLGRFAFIFP